MELTKREEGIYRDGIRLGERNMAQSVEAMAATIREKDAELAKAERLRWWFDNLAMMLRRVIRGELTEKKRSQAGDLLSRALKEVGVHQSILREGAGSGEGA